MKCEKEVILTAVLAVTLLHLSYICGLDSSTFCSLLMEEYATDNCGRNILDDAESCLCELLCSAEITEQVSPGSTCEGSCCNVCFTQCHMCIHIANMQVDMKDVTWMSDFETKESSAFNLLQRKLQNAVAVVLNASQISDFRLQLLGAKKLSWNNITQVYLQLLVRSQSSENDAILLLKNASAKGRIGDFNVLSDSYMMVCGTPSERKQTVEIDLVELGVTCAAAGIILTAIGILLFYCCTTPTQRQRYKTSCCRQTQVAQQNPNVAGI